MGNLSSSCGVPPMEPVYMEIDMIGGKDVEGRVEFFLFFILVYFLILISKIDRKKLFIKMDKFYQLDIISN